LVNHVQDGMDNEGRTDVLRGESARESGFTLIEMVVTLAVFSILLTLAVPSLSRFVANSKVRSAADALQNGIRRAQVESLRRSRRVVFWLTTSQNPQTDLTAAQNGTNWAITTIPSFVDSTETLQVIETGVLSSTVEGLIVKGPAAICFNSMGRLMTGADTQIASGACDPLPTGSPAVKSYQISVNKSVRPLRVDVSLAGQVHMCDPAKTLSATSPDGCAALTP